MAYSLEYYKRQVRNYENQIRSRKNKNATIDSEVSFLQQQYNKLYAIKHSNSPSANYIRTNTNSSSLAGSVEWRGKTKEEFDNLADIVIKSNGKSFYAGIDEMLDTLNNAIKDKRNEKDTGIGLLNNLIRLKNGVESIIRNWTN